MDSPDLKSRVKAYWNLQACGTGVATSSKFTRKYFDEIEKYRYLVEPEIFEFAQFTRFHGKKVLEVGIGAGTDFLQWVRGGARAYGVDLTEEAVDHARERLAVYGLLAENIRVADAENLPYEDGMFDLVYSWGVIHHTPDMERAFAEIVRCTKAGGTIKLMIYNRRSLLALYRWIQHGLLKGKPYLSISAVLHSYRESVGTKAYTRKEISKLIATHPVTPTSISARATAYDLLTTRNRPWAITTLAYLAACLFGFERCGWYWRLELVKH